MNFEDEIIKNARLKRKLHELGIYGMMGPTGPKGKDGEGIKILGSYSSEDELYKYHNIGNAGDAYLINDVLYIWDNNNNTWKKTESIKGPKGDKGDTGLQGIEGKKGEKGDKGDTGEIGPTGPIGPIGPTGEQGIQGEQGVTGPTGPTGATGPIGPRGLPGEIGISEVITIDGTETLNEGEDASVQDDFENNMHHLTFYIPKGDKGEKGDTGPTGPIGPTGSVGPTSYKAIAFASFTDTQTAGISKVYTSRIMPGVNSVLSIPNHDGIVVNETGVYEITLCGRISGVTEDVGASFSLYNATTGTDVSDLLFELNKGSTADMDFSETNFVDIIAPATLQLKTNITEPSGGANIKFTYMNVVIKGFYV